MEPFYSDVGPGNGSVMYREVVGSIGVFEDPAGVIAIGTARCIGSDAAGSAVWRLILQDEELEGAWVIVDREFLSTSRDWRDLYRSELHPDLNGSSATSLPHGRRRGQRAAMARRTTTAVPAAIL
jgi:hypothetical protein